MLRDRGARLGNNCAYTVGVTTENRNVFAGAFVDRSGERRKDDDWLGDALDSDDSRFVPVWRKQFLAAGDTATIVLLTRRQLEKPVDEHELIFLGVFKEHPTFAFAVDEDEPPYGEFGDFHQLRYLGTVLPPDEANLAAHARALVGWHASQVYCGRCGSAARPSAAGNVRICINEDCGRQIFPRVDPAIIVLVHKDDQCLLGRQASWPEGRYSTIAGFVEPGESVEDAVRREVYEETNVRIARVTYHSSQPWPFPSSLMLGFVAEAATTEVRLNDGELDDARWFTRDELLSGSRKLPFHISIARRLVDDWIALGDSR
jgi:NAD+ diphosphatase